MAQPMPISESQPVGPAKPAGMPNPIGQAPSADEANPDVKAKASLDSKSGQDSKFQDSKSPDPKSDDDGPEKTPFAPAASTPASFTQVNSPVQGIAFPAVHAPSPVQPVPPHGAEVLMKANPAPLSAPDIKDVNTPPPTPTGQAPAIDVHIAPPQAPPVDLQVTQRSGQIQVTVRTPDAVLETALRQDLGTLVHSLEHAGFRDRKRHVPVSPVHGP